MHTLVIIEHAAAEIRPGSLAAFGFARAVAGQTGGQVSALVLGENVHGVARAAASYAPVFLADHQALAQPVADCYAKLIADATKQLQVELLVAASTTWSKDIVGRAAGLLGGAMAGDVIGHEFADGELVFHRPMFAGAINATIALDGSPKIVTVRASAYEPPQPAAAPHGIEPISVDAASLPHGICFERLDAKTSTRPDVTEARIVISGGRAFKTAEDFEQLVGRLADKLGAATGSSRELVDAGITPNSLQVGQTGKIVAPDLYVALGISGAVQHLAGMKNSKVIVAINNDPDAPIFEVADYGMVGDVYEIVPELIERLDGANA